MNLPIADHRVLSILVIGLAAILVSAGLKDPLPGGPWRGEFILQDNKRLPFIFLVERTSQSGSKVFLTNADERAPLDSVFLKGDSVVVAINIYDAILIGKVTGDSLKGFYRRNQTPRKGLPFVAVRNQGIRFPVQDKGKPVAVDGKWSVNLTSDNDGKKTTRHAVGILAQQGTKVTGTILTTTGDYRFLEGVIDGRKLKLSAFSGSSPTLIEAELSADGRLNGEFISTSGRTKLEAIKSDTAKLPDPYSLTLLKAGYDRLSFSFPDLKGKQVTLKDDKYKGKVVVVTILGSWCPNCIDEAEFLAPWYKKNKGRGVEVVGLSFERKDDLDFARARLTNLIRRFDVQYDILFAGIADKNVVAEKLPELNTFLSFPTTFFIDKQGKVRKIHTGYNGPATGKYYEEFIKEFNDEVNALVNEPGQGTF